MQTTENIRRIPELEWVDRVSRLLDSQFKVPGTNFRFGIDPLIGLIPIVGDLSSFAISGSLLIVMARHGASRKLLLLMTGNIVLDAILGSIPFIGEIFDFTFKANQRNINLLKKHYHEGKNQGSGIGIIIAIVLGLSALLGLVGFGMWHLFSYVRDLF